MKSSKLAAAVLLAVGSAGASAGVLISTPTLQMGLNSNGSLGFSGVGLSFTGLPAGDRDAITPGCLCEGWGASTGGSVGYAYGGLASGISSSTVTASGASAASVMSSLSNGLNVVHDYSSAAGGSLFRVAITMTNTGAGALNDVRYARTLDWDVPPGHFDDDRTTIYGGTPSGPGGRVIHTSSDPFGFPTTLERSQDRNANVRDLEGDNGAYFVLGFGNLAPGASTTFTTYIGAAGSVTALLSAFGSAGIEAYTYSYDETPGTPTFGWGFAGLGLPPAIPTDPTDPIGKVPAPGTLALLGLGLAGLAGTRRRRAA